MLRPSPPRQARSRATLNRVLSAAEDLFTERGELGFTLPEVARRAGVSVGTVYRRFSSKEELLMAVFDRIQAQLGFTSLTYWESEDWTAMTVQELTERMVADLSKLWREQEPLMRAIMARRLTVSDDVVFEHGVEDFTRGAQLFMRAVRASGRQVQHPDPDAAISFAYRMIVGMCARWAAHDVESMSPEPLPWDAMLEQLSEAVARYLFGAY